MKCEIENCLNDAKPQRCNGDGSYHGHGMVHTKDGKLIGLCDNHHKIDYEKWGHEHSDYLKNNHR